MVKNSDGLISGISAGSFTLGIVTHGGQPVGICLKFWATDNNVYLTHWDMKQSALLLKSLAEYIEYGQHTAFAYRIEQDKTIIENLDKNHPYFTLKENSPSLSDEEIGSISSSTSVVKTQVTGKRDFFHLNITFQNSSIVEIILHEYLVCALLGYITNTCQDIEIALTHENKTIH